MFIFFNRAILWNAVEKCEVAKNSQLAREIEVVLPIELSREKNISLVRDYVKKHFVEHGMCADICVHDSGVGNPHAHIMLTMRPIELDGSWGAKSRKEYILDDNGEKILLKSGEFKSRKVYTVNWNDQTQAEIWRKGWADAVNEVFKLEGIAERLDHRSLNLSCQGYFGESVHALETQIYIYMKSESPHDGVIYHCVGFRIYSADACFFNSLRRVSVIPAPFCMVKISSEGALF